MNREQQQLHINMMQPVENCKVATVWKRASPICAGRGQADQHLFNRRRGLQSPPFRTFMNTELLIDFEAFWQRLAEDIACARDRVWVQTFSFEGDVIGKSLASALQVSSATDKRLLVDSFSKIVVSDRFLYVPRNFFDSKLRSEVLDTAKLQRLLDNSRVQVRYGNPFSISPRASLNRNHKKLVLIDSNIAYIGGMNFSEHNASWHDMMIRISDCDIAAFLNSDFDAAWHGRSIYSTKNFPGIQISTLDGRSNKLAFAKVFDLLDAAEESIIVESPYVTFPFYERLRAAHDRGVRVTIITPRENNFSHFADYARWETRRGGIELRLLRNGMSHLKAILIDGRYLIAGSSNFDFLSYRVYQEILAIITEPSTITDFRERVLDVDLRNSDRAEELVGTTSLRTRLRVRLLNAGLTLLLE